MLPDIDQLAWEYLTETWTLYAKSEDTDSKTKLSTRTTINGIDNGRCIKWYGTGIVRLECFYKNGLLEGPCIEYDRKGCITRSRTFIKDKVTGLYEIFNNGVKISSGIVWESSTCDDLTGESITYDGLYTEWFKDGSIYKLINYKQGLMHGNYISYYENGQVEEKQYYINGRRIGLAKEYYESGVVKSIRRYVDNRLHGKFIDYNENGTITQQGYYRHGHIHGLVRYWNADGVLTGEANYHYRIMHGEYKEWYGPHISRTRQYYMGLAIKH